MEALKYPFKHTGITKPDDSGKKRETMPDTKDAACLICGAVLKPEDTVCCACAVEVELAELIDKYAKMPEDMEAACKSEDSPTDDDDLDELFGD